MDLEPGMHLMMKKAHPCGSSEWELLRAGTDLKCRCCGCGRVVLLPRREAERNIRSLSG